MKNKKAVYLEAAQEKDRLKIGIYTPADVIWRYEDIPVPMDHIRSRCREMMDSLNTTSRNGGGGPIAYEKLKSVGRMLTDELLTNNIKEKLGKSDAEYLILKLDDHLVDIPWELLCVGQEFLCQRFNTGRLVKTRQEIVKNGDRSMARPLKMWILANPEGNLDIADEEGLKIFQDMARMNQKDDIVAPCLDTEITPEDVKESIKNYDFVHFAGHVNYDSHTPGYSGWKLSDGSFTVSDIDKMAGGAPMPTLIFSNACQSARTEKWDGDEDTSFGIPNAFLRTGVRHYVGTSWEIMDEPSSFFAHEFYEYLRSGKTMGQAIKEARCNLTDRYGPDICWASYVLYGDPTVRYFRQQGVPEPKKREKDTTVSRQNSVTRGAFFNYSLNGTKLKEIQTWLFFSFIAVIVAAITVMSGNFASDWIRNEKEKTQDARRVKIQEMLVTRAEKQQERTEVLFEELRNITEKLPVVIKQNPSPLTMVTVFDSQTIKKEKEKIILHAIQDRIIQSHTSFKLLEQESFDIILEELVRKLKLTPPEERNRPRLLMPKLILILEVYDSGPATVVLMRLVEQESRHIFDTLFEELDNSRKVLDQKKRLTEKLLEKLKKYEKGLST
ncbi:MAG: CHAT domain-containing protein [Desulfobacteraceae bacterium]|nr:CHAT domain-containing protein [Desulfobacteraceae bacterium]